MPNKNAKGPDFIGIGAQKSGTTTLYRILDLEERIYLSKPKEIHYFSLHYENGAEWYEKHFKNRGDNQIAGEITPYYLYHRDSAKRIHNYNPEIKIIILLRNPIERTISHYYHAVKRGYEKLGITDALKAEKVRLREGSSYNHQKHSYLSRSLYMVQLERYEALFKKSNILIIKSEDLFNKKDETKMKIFKFLGITDREHSIGEIVANEGDYKKGEIPMETRRWLEDKLTGTIESIREKYGINW